MEEEESSCGGHFGFLRRLKVNILRQSWPPGCFLLGNVVHVFHFFSPRNVKEKGFFFLIVKLIEFVR